MSAGDTYPEYIMGWTDPRLIYGVTTTARIKYSVEPNFTSSYESFIL